MKNILLLMHRFPISRITDAVGMVLVVAFLAIASLNWHEVNELKIGGPRYSRIVDAKDLVADILPPPMYIVEAFLEANILLGHPDQLPVRSSALSCWEAGTNDIKVSSACTADCSSPTSAPTTRTSSVPPSRSFFG